MSLQLKHRQTSGKCVITVRNRCVQNVGKSSVDTTSKEKQVEDEYMEPTDCDWCGKVYELSEGGYVMGDNLCPYCIATYEETKGDYE